MKKCLVVLSVIVFALAFVASDLMAYQESFDSAGHRTQSRNAANGTIDAAYYNPTGLLAMKDGLFVDVGNRILSLTTKTKINTNLGVTPSGHETESSTMSYLLPNLALVYKAGKAAAFYTLDIRGGGAGGEWSGKDAQALAALMGAGASAQYFTKIEGTTYTLGHTLGGSFALTDMVSLSAGLRYFQYQSEMTKTIVSPAGKTTIESETTMDGYAPFIGVQVAAMQGLNISLQFQGRSFLIGEEVTSTTGAPTTESEDVTVQPSVLYFGAGYTVMPGLEVMLSYTREFTAEHSYGNEYLWDKGDSDKQVFGLGAEYTVAPGILVSAGLAYKLTGTAAENNNYPPDPSFNEIDLGFGGVYTAMPGLNFQLAFAYNIYSESEYKPTGAPTAVMKHNRSAWVIGLGVSYQIF
jgi:long-subunit fatty acid transport protein